jgi:hypothetical protein
MNAIRLIYDIHFYENGKYGDCENISKAWIYLFTVYLTMLIVLQAVQR